MDKLGKALKKLSAAEREKIRKILLKIISGATSNLDLKKLKGKEGIFRVRSGSLRVIYREDDKGKAFILSIARRNEKTYKI